MSKVNINVFFLILIFVLFLIQSIYCAADSIYLNKRGCFFKDKFFTNQIVISFEYEEGYYRAIHANYDVWKTEAVVMKYLGDSSKDIKMKCIISPGYRKELSSSSMLFHYTVPCTFANIALVNEGTYCIEIVKSLIGDIESGDYCTDDYSFKVTTSTSISSLSVVRFSEGQIGCIQPGETVTLLATVKNKMSNTQDYGNIGIGIDNTEIVSESTALQCKIEGQKNVGSSDKITCIIPTHTPTGEYSIFYDAELVESSKCPINIINDFNSLNFNGEVTKLKISHGFSNGFIEATLSNITFGNSSEILGLFNLTFSLKSILNTNYLIFENFKNKDVGIKLMDTNGVKINTKCEFNQQNNIDSFFYLICKLESYDKETKYSLLISDNIIVGYDSSQVYCQYGESTIYKKIKIYSATYDFFIIYDDDNNPYLDCDTNHGTTSAGVENMCGSCGLNCLLCDDQNSCAECLEGFSLKISGECALIKDSINFTSFQEIK